MESADRRLLEAAIQDPLERVVGSVLGTVAYFVPNVDVPDYDLNAPNESGGCQGVRLVFSGGDVELDWDFREPAFRDEAAGHYLAVRGASERSACFARSAELGDAAFSNVDATQAEPWRVSWARSCRR